MEEKYLEENLNYLNMEPKVFLAVQSAFCTRKDFYLKAALNAYAGEVPLFPICRYSPLERLTVICVLLTHIRERYQAHGIPQEVFLDTISDITLRQRLYRNKTGKIGISPDDAVWFRHINAVRIFKLGALQFQLFSMVYLDLEGCGEDYMEYLPDQKQVLPEGVPVINMHIQRGADLSPTEIEDSIQYALDFFPHYFPEHHPKAFLCYSWLLYPGMEQLLPSNSNILQFARRFQIIGTSRDRSEAIQSIYGRYYRRKADFPQITSLQHRALGHFSSLGNACGIIPIEDLP